MKHIISILVILSIFNSCKVSENQISKKTVFWGDSKILPGSTLVLHPDGNFKYEFIHSLVGVFSEGTWYENESEIIFNSNPSYKNGYLRIDIQSEKEFKDSMRLELMFEQYDSHIENATMTINDDNEVSFNQERKAFFYVGKIDSIKINFIGDEYKHSFTDGLLTDVKIFLNPLDINKRYFEEERWQKVGRNLLSPREILYKRKNIR